MKRNLLMLPLLAALAGCAAMDGMNFLPEVECFDDSECYAGQQCSFARCTWQPEFALDLEVTPLPASGYLFQSVEAIDFDRTEPLKVLVAEPLLLSLESPVEASARFTTSEGLRRSRTFETLLEIDQGTTQARAELALMAGVRDGASDALIPMAYDLVAEPLAGGCCGGAGECTAPVRQSGVVPTADSTFVLPLDLATAPVILTGQVLVSEANWTPVENLQVQLFDPATGVRSLASHTDPEGRFCLAVVRPPAGSAHRMTLRLGPSESRPTLEFDAIEVGADDLDLGAYFTGDHGTPVTVTGNKIVGPDQAPVQGARVSLVGEVETSGTFRQTAVSDELGRFEVRLLAGTYLAQISTPEDSPLASATVASFVVSSDPTIAPAPLEVQLLPRPVLRGAVRDGQTDTPVEDLEVVASRIVPTGPSEEAPVMQTFRTRTDAEGKYVLPVDAGSYLMHFRPRGGSGLPWSVGHAVTVNEADLSLETVVLDAPALLSGTVLGERADALSETLGGSQVEIVGRTPDGRLYPVGEAWADEAGVFEAVLPQSLAGGSGL
ncbi:MAG: carboxypeptidase-like regulatory domain-containing protein [Deltaproteobacteria bacterium]|nr:carboxypeptidase-like regulatory domain-containing protein [Deltaproteobacteria bacterium]